MHDYMLPMVQCRFPEHTHTLSLSLWNPILSLVSASVEVFLSLLASYLAYDSKYLEELLYLQCHVPAAISLTVKNH
jgi:hypothetical protein